MIDLYTASTPNGWKVSVCLDELAVPYEVHPLELSAGEQKEDWFLKVCPNGRIPAIVDRDANWCWARIHQWPGVTVDGLDNLQRWMTAMEAPIKAITTTSVGDNPEIAPR